MASPLSPEQVRIYIKDRADSNYLITGEEFSDERIELAMELTVDTFNFMTPTTNYDLTKIGRASCRERVYVLV